MNKENKRKTLLDLIAIFISAFALVISALSFWVSNKTLDYEVEKDSFFNTPAISENIDSLDIIFGLNNTQCEIQAMRIIFPTELSKYNIEILTKPISINRQSLDFVAHKYLDDRLQKRDSIMSIGVFALPVIFEYSAIVFGVQQDLRENRNLLFHIINNNDLSVKYSNSFLLQRSGYPIKKQLHIALPFGKPIEKKIYDKHMEDVYELLDEQLKQNSFNIR